LALLGFRKDAKYRVVIDTMQFSFYTKLTLCTVNIICNTSEIKWYIIVLVVTGHMYRPTQRKPRITVLSFNYIKMPLIN